ncbi:hypothetical protein HDU76_006551, partial [Blyttiomyces sp. JEL0837]
MTPVTQTADDDSKASRAPDKLIYSFQTPERIEDIFTGIEIEKLRGWIDGQSTGSDVCLTKTLRTRLGGGSIVPVKWTLCTLGIGGDRVDDGEIGKTYVHLIATVDLTANWNFMKLATMSPAGKIVEAMRKKDWTSTSVGNIDTWPTVVLSAISVIMNVTSTPMVVAFGKDCSVIPNEAYAEAFSISPDKVGEPLRVVRKEAFEGGIKFVIHKVLKGETVRVLRFPQLHKRQDGSWEERIYSTTTMPLRNDTGYIEGLQTILIENTATILAQERLILLKSFLERLLTWTSIDQLFSEFSSIVNLASDDIAYSAIYMFEKTKSILRSVSVVNLDESHHALPCYVDLVDEASKTNEFPLLECFRTNNIMELHDLKTFHPLPSGHPANPFARQAVLIPFKLVSDGTQGGYEGVLVVGVCAQRSLDNDHEIRAPLSLVLGPIDDCLAQLEKTSLPSLPNQTKDDDISNKSTLYLCQRKMSMARDNAVRIKVLVDRLLDFHKLEAGKMKPRFVQVNLTALTRNTIEVFRAPIEAKGLTCDTTELQDLHELCVVDVDMWEKILFNLISNATKFTEKGRISFALSHNKSSEEVIFEVTDTGPGISDNEKHLVFTRFYRSPETAGSIEGTGIGLSLVKELVCLHHGTVTVVNQGPGSIGTSIRVIIPRKSPEIGVDNIDFCNNIAMAKIGQNIEQSKAESQLQRPKTIGYVESYWHGPLRSDTQSIRNKYDTDAGAVSKRKNGRNDTSGMHLMVIDDNPDMRSYVTEILSEKWNVHAFSTAEDALNALQHLKTDLVVCDILLPKMSGLDFTRIVRNNEQTQDLPVFFLTAKATEESRINGLLSGADDYVIKPFSRKELVSRINTRLELQKLRKELEELVSSRTAELVNEKKRVKPEFHAEIFESLKIMQEQRTPVRHQDMQLINERWIVAETIPEFDENSGEFVGAVSCLTDVTESKNMQTQKLQAMEEAERVQRRRADEAEELKKQK